MLGRGTTHRPLAPNRYTLIYKLSGIFSQADDTQTQTHWARTLTPPPPLPPSPYLGLHVVPGLLQSVLMTVLVVLNEVGHDVAHFLL